MEDIKKNFSFSVKHQNKNYRVGLIQTHRGEIDTPAFMPVGTQATVKGVFIDDIIKTGSQIILSNTYHLMIRPGTERVEAVGGLHKFMNCKLPILTDSGGYQVMSLSKFNKIDRDKGAIFQSHIDGKTFILSPEESIKIQKKLNSDIVMVMDECPKNTKDYNKIKNSMELSTEWAKRSKNEFGNNPHKALFGIVQGGLFNDLRIESLKKLINIKFDGYAIGGLAVGETQKEMFDVLDGIKDFLPEDNPVVKTLDLLTEEFGGGFGETTSVLIEGDDLATPEVHNALIESIINLADKENIVVYAGNVAAESVVGSMGVRCLFHNQALQVLLQDPQTWN